jgi:hypothetical protein
VPELADFLEGIVLICGVASQGSSPAGEDADSTWTAMVSMSPNFRGWITFSGYFYDASPRGVLASVSAGWPR